MELQFASQDSLFTLFSPVITKGAPEIRDPMGNLWPKTPQRTSEFRSTFGKSYQSLTTSPPAAVPSPLQALASIESLMNATWPSAKPAFTPPPE